MAGTDNDNESGGAGFDLDQGFRLGDVEVLPRQSIIIRDGERLHLEKRPMDVLVCLARHAPDTVTRQQFEDEVWPDRVVTPQNLDRAISVLRSTLKDDAREPRFVQTIQSVGYRLICDVAPLVEPQPATRPARRWLGAGIALVAVLVVVLLLVERGDIALDGPPLSTISVQCFDNLSGEPDSEYFADGLAEEIRTALARVDGIDVVSRTSSQAFCESGLPISAIGAELDAGSVLEGTVRRAGDQVRISVQLGKAANDHVLLSQDYSGAFADIFELQNEIATDVAGRLQVQLAPGAQLVVAPTDDLEAYQLYLRAYFQLHRRGIEPIRRSIDLFQQAIDRDPGYGAAYQGLAEAFAVAPSYTGAENEPFVEMALAALDEAEALGGTDAHAHAIRGLIQFQRWKWMDARREFEAALAGEPDNSDLLQWYSQFLAGLGYIDEALTLAKRSVEQDPLSPVAHQRLGVVLMWYDDLEGAAERFRIATEELGLSEWANARSMFPLMLRQGQFELAERYVRDMLSSSGEPMGWIEPWLAYMRGEAPDEPAIAALRVAFAAGLDSRIYVGALYFLGNADALFDAIDEVRAAGRPLDHEVWFVQEGRLLQNDPRFPGLLEQFGVLDYWDEHGWPSGCARLDALIQCERNAPTVALTAGDRPES